MGKASQNRRTKLKKATIRFEASFFICSHISGKYRKFQLRFLPQQTDEVRHDRTYFRLISENKEVSRTMLSFSSGLLLIDPKITKFMRKMYDEHSYLWSDTMEYSLEEFVKSDPLTVTIREKFQSFDQITADLRSANRMESIDSIIIQMDEAFEDFIEYSKQWKVCLGQLLRALYKKKLSDSVEFIEDVELVLQRPLNDLDDVGIAMECLKKIRENCIEYDTLR